MAINQNDKVIRKINVNGTPHEISAKYLGDYTYSDINDELISRLQGKSNNTDAKTDPFKYINLGQLSSVPENMVKFSSWLDNLYEVNEQGEFLQNSGGVSLGKQGYYRIIVNNQSSIEVQIVQMSSSMGAIMEIVKGPITISNGTNKETVSEMNYECYNIYHRVHYDYTLNGVKYLYWTDWSSEQDSTIELNKRIQGNSVSSVNFDPFIKLSWNPRNKSDENDTTPDINDYMNDLCPSTDDYENKTGHFRAYSNSGTSCLDIKVDVLSWANDNNKERFMQTVSGPVTLKDNNTKLYWVNGVPRLGSGCYYRLSERAKTETVRTWSEWKPVNNSYIEQVLTPIYSNPRLDFNATDNNSNCYGYVGTLKDINVNGDLILIDSISVYVREGKDSPNLDIPVWCRLLKFVNNTWKIVYQSTESKTIRGIAPETLFSFKMKAKDDTDKLIKSTDRIAITYVNSETASVLSGVELGFKAIMGTRGGLVHVLANNSTGHNDWCPAFVIKYLSMAGNVVNIEDDQTITGAKNFTSEICINGKSYIRKNIDTGELKVCHGKENENNKGFIVRTVDPSSVTTPEEFQPSIYQLQMLSTDGRYSYRYDFPMESGEILIYREVTYSYLVYLRDNYKLVPGAMYRITDFVTKAGLIAESGEHQFDIIVVALSKNELSENAKVCLHDYDENSVSDDVKNYFKKSNVNAWEIKYTIDKTNDGGRFAWVTTGCKGIIYYMKDEWGNEASYDFKNLKFQSDSDGKYYYTFSYVENGEIFDATIKTKNVRNNKILPTYDSDGKMTLGYNIFRLTTNQLCISNYLGENCNHNTFGTNCICNVLNAYCSNNKFGNECQYNTLEEYCVGNIFGNQNQSNTFGVGCNANKFGNKALRVSFGHKCIGNILGDNCNIIVFGDACQNNKFGNNVQLVTFISNCQNNIFGNYYQSITFGSYCINNIFINEQVVSGKEYDTYTPINYLRYIKFGDACQNNIFWTTDSVDSSNWKQMYDVDSYIISKNIELKSSVQAGYTTTIAKNSSGHVKQYCLTDLIK